jgi:3-hydroxyisobutyrate dehydrogenase-like beta-hydroxyacid dehydrogenase
MRAGLIGAGLLGSALAERFADAGIDVMAFDLDSRRMEALAAIGCRAAESAREAAQHGDLVILCLPDSRISSQVARDIAPALGAETILIDTTTGEPEEMAAIAGMVPRYVDATIAGSSGQVRSREAVVLAGGAIGDIDACRPLFATFSPRVFHAGGCGAGARMKLVVNLVLGLNRAALAEGLAFARASGIDMALALDVLRNGPAYSVAMDRKGAKMLNRDWTPEARLRQHHKDVRLILAQAARAGLILPLSTTHDALLSKAEELGFADSDNSAVFEAWPSTDGAAHAALAGRPFSDSDAGRSAHEPSPARTDPAKSVGPGTA